MGCQSQDATDAKPGNGQGAGFEVPPCPDAAARPGISGSPLSWPRSSSEQWRRWQTSVYHTLLSVGGRILDQFKCFSLFQRQPSWKCYILRSWWSLKDYFNPSLGHVGETLTVKISSRHAVSELREQWCGCGVLPALKWQRWTLNVRLSLSGWLEGGGVRMTTVDF